MRSHELNPDKPKESKRNKIQPCSSFLEAASLDTSYVGRRTSYVRRRTSDVADTTMGERFTDDLKQQLEGLQQALTTDSQELKAKIFL